MQGLFCHGPVLAASHFFCQISRERCVLLYRGTVAGDPRMLALLETLRTSKQQGHDCQAALHALERRLRRFRSLMHKIDPEQRRDEPAIFNAALYAIFNAIEDFRGRTEREAIAFCRTVVWRMTISHLRAVTWPAGRTEFLETIPAPGPTSEERLLEEERHQVVHKALALLRPEEQL